MLKRLHVYHDSVSRSAAMNMAVDEALLALAPVPSLRFYRWRRPSISFGYFGAYSDVAAEQIRRELVRRWTGGGIVFHGDDLTYSVVLPADDAAAFRSSRAVYAEIHSAVQQALGTESGATLVAAAASKISDACFANPVAADVIANGRKIAGAAQRRTRAGLLHQGSILYDALPPHFADAFAAQLCERLEKRSFTPELLARAQEIAAERYATEAWLRRR